MARSFTQSEVNKIFGHLNARTVRFWVESGLVRWASEHEDGRGVHKSYDRQGLCHIGLVEELMEINLTIKMAKTIMEVVSDYDLQRWENALLVFNKVKPTARKAQDAVDKDKPQTVIAYKEPGFHNVRICPVDFLVLEEEMVNDSLYLVIVNLKSILEKVNQLISRTLP